MNYKKVYDQLIRKRQTQILIKLPKSNSQYIYCESHHIIPKCLGGTDDNSNIVNLTFREHYICHLLLVFHYRAINNKSAFYKMLKALQSFKNLNYGTMRNEIFFANSLFNKLTRSYLMPQSTKRKLSKARKGKKWTKAQREEWETRKKYNQEHGIKHKAWNKGIPLSNLTKKRMKRTIKKFGNKNLGRKATKESKIKECYTKLSHKYPNIDWNNFDFKTYIDIPRLAYVKVNNKRVYARHIMVANYIKQHVSEDIYLKMKNDYNRTHPCGNSGKKFKKKSRKKLFISRHKHFFPDVNWDIFDFNEYESISKKKRRKYIKDFIEQQRQLQNAK